ncbi:MAG: hypothetical protein AB1428_00525 [Bacteroidota bacterium]
MTATSVADSLTFRRYASLAVVLILGGALWASLTVVEAWKSNGEPSFPLDDIWIHLQFARNLHDFGSFSYFRGAMATAGSTSPLYTFILASGMFLTSDHLVLCAVLGILSYALAGYFLFLLAYKLFGDAPWFSLAAVLLFMLEPRLRWGAQSGMETLLFVAGVLASLWAFASSRRTALGFILATLLWVRPEAMVLIGVFAAAEALAVILSLASDERHGVASTASEFWSRVRLPLAFIALSFLGYALFNYRLSGSPFPNTLAAKIAYYGVGSQEYLSKVAAYLAGGHFLIVAPLAVAGCVKALADLVGRRGVSMVPLVLWGTALVVMYGMKLPYLYQQGRYLMPVLPILLLLALAGLHVLTGLLFGRLALSRPTVRSTIVAGTVVLVISVHSVVRGAEIDRDYVDSCRYITERHVATGRWLHDHTPEDAVVATHDIGAIAYYSGRKVVDVQGVVTPSAVRVLSDLDSLKSFLVASGVSHLAVMRLWYDVVNVSPLFASRHEPPEVMEVFAFDSARLHFVTRAVSDATQAGLDNLARGNVALAGPILEWAVQVDPLSSRAQFGLALARRAVGQRGRAEEALLRAIALQPDLWSAQVVLAQLEIEGGRVDEGIQRLEWVIGQHPDYTIAYRLLAETYAETKGDSLRAQEVRDQYRRNAGKGELF